MQRGEDPRKRIAATGHNTRTAEHLRPCARSRLLRHLSLCGSGAVAGEPEREPVGAAPDLRLGLKGRPQARVKEAKVDRKRSVTRRERQREDGAVQSLQILPDEHNDVGTHLLGF